MKKREKSFGSKLIRKVFAALMAALLCANVAATDSIAADATIELMEEGVTVLFEGGKPDQYFETTDVEWLMKAADDDVFTVVYSCEDASCLGWGILGWRGTVDGNWVGAWDINADATDATTRLYSRYTVKDVKESLGITENSVVDKFALGAWNKGKIEALYLSSAENAPEIKDAKAGVVTGAAKTELEPLTGDYIYIFEKPEELEVWYADYCQYLNPGQTVHLTVEMESNGDFGGALGTCVNNWAWQMEEFSSDAKNQATVTWFHTPLLNNFKVMMWWVNGTQVGIKSIKIEKAIDYSAPADTNQAPGYTVAHSGSINPTTDWNGVTIPLAELLGNVAPSNVDYIVFSSATSFWIGYNAKDGSWGGSNDMCSYRFTDIDFANYNLLLGHGADTPIQWEVVEKENTGDSGNAGAGTSPVVNGQTATLTANSDCVEVVIPLENLLGGVSADRVESITFTGNVNFQVGYGQSAEPYWSQTGDVTTFDLDVESTNLQLDPQWYAVKLFVFVNDGNEYTISWEVNEKTVSGGGSGATPITGSTAFVATGDCAEYAVPLVDLLCGVEANNVKSITFTSDVNFQIGYGLIAEPYWSQTGDVTSYEIDVEASNLQLDPQWYALKLFLFMNDGASHTINWEIETK